MPIESKKADVTSIFKKDDFTKAKNYRPVSVLPIVSKAFERIMHKQISQYISQFLSPYLSGYRQSFSTQQALVSLIEKWKAILDENGYAGTVLGSLKSFWYHKLWSLNSQTECLWFHEKFIEINKKLPF